MQIRQLLSFISVARTKNMAQTAVALNYSHSTIYGHLEALEKEFHTKLYSRTSHGIELTSQGEVFLNYAKQFIALYQEASQVLTGQRQNKILIGASETGDICIMHQVFHEYVQRMPNVEIEYVKMTTETLISKLLSNTCDLAVICEFNFHPETVCTQYLGTIPLIFVMSAELDWTAASPPKLLGTMAMRVAMQMLQSVGVEFKDYFSAFSNIGDLDTVRQLACYKQGIALLPAMYVAEDLENGTLKQLPFLMEEIPLDVYMTTLPKKPVGPYTQRLIDLTFEIFNPQHKTKNHMLVKNRSSSKDTQP